MDNTSSFSNETQYHILKNDVNSKFDNGIDNYLLNKDVEPPQKEPNLENNKISISKVLFE